MLCHCQHTPKAVSLHKTPIWGYFRLALFQKLMDVVLQRIPAVACYSNDILISTKNERQHLQTLEEVFQRLEQHGFRLKEDKCVFITPSVEYLCQLKDQEENHPPPSKVEAIVQAPTSTSIHAGVTVLLWVIALLWEVYFMFSNRCPSPE